MTLRCQVQMADGKVRYGAPEEKLFGGKEVYEFVLDCPFAIL